MWALRAGVRGRGAVKLGSGLLHASLQLCGIVCCCTAGTADGSRQLCTHASIHPSIHQFNQLHTSHPPTCHCLP